jgi:hypothetical protein
MNPAVLILTSLGSIVAFITGVTLVIRAIFKNVTATRDNTNALHEVIEMVTKLRAEFDNVKTQVAVLWDRQERR